ncbi:hypothetical protein EMMF5_001210 [Cystobasidiomycetes sp. EMM_F5]
MSDITPEALWRCYSKLNGIAKLHRGESKRYVAEEIDTRPFQQLLSRIWDIVTRGISHPDSVSNEDTANPVFETIPQPDVSNLRRIEYVSSDVEVTHLGHPAACQTMIVAENIAKRTFYYVEKAKK